jgi:hypothetical protein
MILRYQTCVVLLITAAACGQPTIDASNEETWTPSTEPAGSSLPEAAGDSVRAVPRQVGLRAVDDEFSELGEEQVQAEGAKADRTELEVLEEPTARNARVRPDSPYSDLGKKLESIPELIDSVRTVLRPDTGTLTADAAFIRLRGDLRDRVREVMAEINDREFQADVWPAGAAASFRRREEQRHDRRPTAEDEARADSILAILRAHGIWATRSEGDTYFSADEALIQRVLGPYLTPSMRDFLEMQVDEQERSTADDGALMIPLDELTRRIRSTEQYMESHPGSLVLNVVRSMHRWYLAIYLAGLPSSGPFHWETQQLDPQWRMSMERYAHDYGDSASGQVVSRYLSLLEASGFQRSEEIDAFRTELWRGSRPGSFP